MENYMDDFITAEHTLQINEAYLFVGKLFVDLGLEKAKDKDVPATPVIEFLGTLLDAINQIMMVTPERLVELRMEMAE